MEGKGRTTAFIAQARDGPWLVHRVLAVEEDGRSVEAGRTEAEVQTTLSTGSRKGGGDLSTDSVPVCGA
eukprot:evm.model.NODE_48254_length_1262_cov_14.240888.1